MRLLLTLALISPAGAYPSAPSIDQLLRQAHIDAHPALIDSYLLSMAIQANLLDLKWALGRLGVSGRKAKAGEHYQRYSGELDAFLKACEAADAQTNPLQEQILALMKTDRVKKAAENVPESASEQVAEIRRLRDEYYDGEASRSALIRVRAALSRLEPALGAPRLLESQARTVSLARGLVGDVRAILSDAALLPEGGKSSPAGALAAGDLRRIRRDASELDSVLDLLDLYFRLNNYHARGGASAASLRDAPAAVDPQATFSDPDMLSEVKKADAGNLDAALGRAGKDARSCVDALGTLIPSARSQVAAGASDARDARRAARIDGSAAILQSVEDSLDALLLAGQMMGVKEKLLREKLGALALVLPSVAPAEIAAARASYRDKDRLRDLQKAEGTLSRIRADAAKDGVSAPLTAEQAAAVSALQALTSEVRAAAASMSDLRARLLQGTLTAGSEAARRVSARAGQLQLESADLAREARLLEIAFAMGDIDTAKFDKSK